MAAHRAVAAAIAGGCLAAGLAACGGGGAASGGSSGGGSGNSKVSVTYIQGHADPYFDTIASGARAEAKAEGATLSVQGPTAFDPSLQIPIINSVVARHPSAIVISPTDPNAVLPPLKKGNSQGIKITTVDGVLSDNSIVAGQVLNDSVPAGEKAASLLAHAMNGHGSVLELNTMPGDTTPMERLKGFQQGIKKYPAIKPLGVQLFGNDPQKATSIVRSTLAAHPDLGGIIATQTTGTEGAATAIKSAGKAGKVKIVGFDAEKQEAQLVKQGVVVGIFASDACAEGKGGVKQAVAAAQGKTPSPRVVHLPNIMITKSNMSQPRVAHAVYGSSCTQ